MMGRKSKNNESIFAVHSLYLSPTFIIDKKINLFTRFGYNVINSDTDENSFDSLSGGYNFGVGMMYKISDNYAISIHHVQHEANGKSDGLEYLFSYNRYGITLSYGLDIK